MIRRIDHVGIAVHHLGRRLPFWAEVLGLRLAGTEDVDREGVRVALLPAGDSRIELLEPTREDSVVARFLQKHGEGIHHLTLEVENLEAALARLDRAGVRAVGEAPGAGAEGAQVAFLHPRSTGGVLLELVERPRDEGRGAAIEPGQAVLAYLREPGEKLWGVLRRLDTAGLVLEGIDLGSFDDWVAQEERREESIVGPSILFVPTSRIEKILLDRPSGRLPSLAERFLLRTGRTVQEALGGGGDPGAR